MGKYRYTFLSSKSIIPTPATLITDVAYDPHEDQIILIRLLAQQLAKQSNQSAPELLQACYAESQTATMLIYREDLTALRKQIAAQCAQAGACPDNAMWFAWAKKLVGKERLDVLQAWSRGETISVFVWNTDQPWTSGFQQRAPTPLQVEAARIYLPSVEWQDKIEAVRDNIDHIRNQLQTLQFRRVSSENIARLKNLIAAKRVERDAYDPSEAPYRLAQQDIDHYESQLHALHDHAHAMSQQQQKLQEEKKRLLDQLENLKQQGREHGYMAE